MKSRGTGHQRPLAERHRRRHQDLDASGTSASPMSAHDNYFMIRLGLRPADPGHGLMCSCTTCSSNHHLFDSSVFHTYASLTSALSDHDKSCGRITATWDRDCSGQTSIIHKPGAPSLFRVICPRHELGHFVREGHQAIHWRNNRRIALLHPSVPTTCSGARKQGMAGSR